MERFCPYCMNVLSEKASCPHCGKDPGTYQPASHHFPPGSLLHRRGGCAYVYLCYGIHWLFNVITGPEGFPQGVLIRACEGYEGPGKLTKRLGITGAHNGLDLCSSEELRIEDVGNVVNIITDKRVGIAYADKADRERLWRFKRG